MNEATGNGKRIFRFTYNLLEGSPRPAPGGAALQAAWV